MTPAARTSDRPLACIVMAGGKGTRMRSSLTKVLHPIWGRPLLGWVLAAVAEAGAERVVVVVPPDAAEAVAAVATGAETVVRPPSVRQVTVVEPVPERMNGVERCSVTDPAVPAGTVEVVTGARDVEVLRGRSAEPEPPHPARVMAVRPSATPMNRCEPMVRA